MDDYGAGFAEHIHQYNNAFAFTSLGVKVDQSVLNSLGPYAFKIMGELSHLSGSLLPVAGTDPVFAQIYVYDEAEAQAIRMRRNGNLQPYVMGILETMSAGIWIFNSGYMFHTFRIQAQPKGLERETLLWDGHLFQEYICDAWATIDQDRLKWLRLNQTTLRTEVYKSLTDAMSMADLDQEQVGKRFILPSSYHGGARHMNQLFQDAMAITRHFVKPNLFLTMTTNPKWPEIMAALLRRQQPSDRPDIVAQVFNMKKNALLHNIFKNHVLGKTVAKVYTIEFQKRGLPHMHLLIFLEPQYKFRDPESVDQLISAEIPDPFRKPHLHGIVSTVMVHGPCGAGE